MAANQPQLSITTTLELQSAVRSAAPGLEGPSRTVRLARACTSGGGSISKDEDGTKCAIAGKESLRILTALDPFQHGPHEHKSASRKDGYRLNASRNYWEGSGLKLDSASTDVAWARGVFSNKILTSARNGELILWDLNKSGPVKYETKEKLHNRSINQVCVSHVVEHYCITGSADQDVRVWDLRDFHKFVMRIHYPTCVRAVAFSSSSSHPLQAAVGLDNGNVYRWDLKMGQRGQLDRIPLAHTAAVTSLDWRSIPHPNFGECHDWLVSSGMDRMVKVWDLSLKSHKPSYVLQPAFPVRRVKWRPGNECEVAVVSNAELGLSPDHDLSTLVPEERKKSMPTSKPPPVGHAVELWDVRRGSVAKWQLRTGAGEGSVNDIAFPSPDILWACHSSGTFSQADLREVRKPLEAIPRVGATWEAFGSLAFVSYSAVANEVPYEDRSERKAKLGDPVYVPDSQSFGTWTSVTDDDVEALEKLARTYVFEGKERHVLCELNGMAAYEVGKDEAGQVWLLMSAALSDVIPSSAPPSIPPRPKISSTAPSPLASYTFPASPCSGLAKKTSPHSGSASKNGSPNMRSTSQASTSRNSSNSPSPRQRHNALPPVNHLRRESLEGPSGAMPGLGVRRPSAYRRPSHSLSGSDRSSLKLVGEGALDDSDSSSSEGSNGAGIGADSEESEQANLRPLISPGLVPTRSTTAVPSPLSRRWTDEDVPSGNSNADEDEDEEEQEVDDENSPSPRPTSSESEEDSEDDFSRTRANSKSMSRRGSSGSKVKKSRSRNSTLASLSVPKAHRTGVSRQRSDSSIQTVIAPDDTKPTNNHINASAYEESAKNSPAPPPTVGSHSRNKSVAVSELILDPYEGADADGDDAQSEMVVTARQPHKVASDELRLRGMLWDALKDALERFANQGNVQMCTVMALIAPKELGVSKRRLACFLEAYIDLLTRLRLHSCSAYLRRYCTLDDIRKPTTLETTIYMSCGQCGKPMLQSSHGFCPACRKSVSCAICHLPVKGLLFQCSLCTHGGHYMCYTHYFGKQTSLMEPSTKIAGEHHEEENDVREKIAGQQCPAGCGHVCWTASGAGGAGIFFEG